VQKSQKQSAFAIPSYYSHNT